MPAFRQSGALVFGALFCLCLSLSSPASPLCPATGVTESAVVHSVTDGDTLRLEDGRKIRLIGINAPEIAHDHRPAEALGNDAKSALYRLLAPSRNRIGLQYGSERFDKYQRTLAHIYLTDGSSVQAAMLELGMATAFTTPPNASNSDCYQAAEHLALQQQRGIWARPEYQPKTSNQLSASDDGFRRLRGRVSRIDRARNGMRIMLGEKIKIYIAANDLLYFPQPWLEKLPGKQLEIRGWLHADQHQFFMQLRHPAAITLLEPNVAAVK